MPATDLHGSSSSLGRSILALRRDPHSSAMDPTADEAVDAFHRRVAGLLLPLAAGTGDLLSASWIGELLGAFLAAHAEFYSLLAAAGGREVARRAPMDRLLAELSDRSVKALDVCNAVRDGIESVRRISRHAEIAVAALGGPRAVLGEGQFRRARRALTELTIAMLDEKEAGSAVAHRNRSFGKPSPRAAAGNFRSLSWSVSRSWSAARQLQAIAGNLAAPRSSEAIATGGLAGAVFAMNCVVLLAMWTLVAAIPCQDRGLQAHFPAIPRGFAWAAPLAAVHDRVAEEARRRERRSSCGLLSELLAIEWGARGLVESTEGVQPPLGEEREAEVRARAAELSAACEAMKGGLEPLEARVREVFQRIARSRTERLDGFGDHS